MRKAKIRKVGNSLGATISKEVLEKLRVSEGDTVDLLHESGDR